MSWISREGCGLVQLNGALIYQMEKVNVISFPPLHGFAHHISVSGEQEVQTVSEHVLDCLNHQSCYLGQAGG